MRYSKSKVSSFVVRRESVIKLGGIEEWVVALKNNERSWTELSQRLWRGFKAILLVSSPDFLEDLFLLQVLIKCWGYMLISIQCLRSSSRTRYFWRREALILEGTNEEVVGNPASPGLVIQEYIMGNKIMSGRNTVISYCFNCYEIFPRPKIIIPLLNSSSLEVSSWIYHQWW